MRRDLVTAKQRFGAQSGSLAWPSSFASAANKLLRVLPLLSRASNTLSQRSGRVHAAAEQPKDESKVVDEIAGQSSHYRR